MELRLSESEHKYRDLVENMTEGLITIDEKKNIIFVNSKFCQMLEYKPEELIGRNIFDFFDSKNQKILKQELARPKEHFPIRNHFYLKIGKPIPTIISGFQILMIKVYFSGLMPLS